MQRDWLARNIRARRHALGMSAREVSARAGLHLRLWQKLEGGETNATLATLAKVCEALGVDIVELMQEPRRPSAR